MAALEAWDSGEAWTNGGHIQIQVSRSKRLLPEPTHANLDQAQQTVVDDLDNQVEELREQGSVTAWNEFYNALYGPKRDQIDGLLFSLNQHLDLAQRTRLIRWWRQVRGNAPDPIRVGPQWR
jgi:PAS domain-containing protein